MSKFIFITGGVISSLGKGITSATIGRLLKKRGFKVFNQKFDPYFNVDPNTMSPAQHGEVFVTDDGGETDLDIGHYERFENVSLSKDSDITSGMIYSSVISKERAGLYNGKTVQVIPHITNEIKQTMKNIAANSQADFVIVEIGGTVGDIESLPYIEAIRQMRQELGKENTMFIHATLVPLLRASEEIKTKPTQQSVNSLRGFGIQPDILVLRSEIDVPVEDKEKIAMFCGVPYENIIQAIDVPVIYEIVPKFKAQHIDDVILKHFNMTSENPGDVSDWIELINKIKAMKDSVTVGLCGKFVVLHDAYLSVSKALEHAGFKHNVKVKIKYINCDEIESDNLENIFSDIDGIIFPGEEKEAAESLGRLLAIEYARVHDIPTLAINYGMKCLVKEFAKNVAHIKETKENPVIVESPDCYDNIKLINNMRLGSFEANLTKNSKAYNIYQSETIFERHRNLLEINNNMIKYLQDAGLVISGINNKTQLIEVVELLDNKFYIGVNYHPEFLTRVLKPHPLFDSFVNILKEHKGVK